MTTRSKRRWWLVAAAALGFGAIGAILFHRLAPRSETCNDDWTPGVEWPRHRVYDPEPHSCCDGDERSYGCLVRQLLDRQDDARLFGELGGVATTDMDVALRRLVPG